MNPTGAKVAANQQNVRASERFDLEVKVDLESDHNFYTGLTQNISAGGCSSRRTTCAASVIASR